VTACDAVAVCIDETVLAIAQPVAVDGDPDARAGGERGRCIPWGDVEESDGRSVR
jgi:hypothetical protein